MPSSRYLARDAVRLVAERLGAPQRDSYSLLELGPGTGIFTEHILPNIRHGDHFDVVELNSYFYKILHRKFRFNGDICLHHADFLKFQPDRTYDFVISSLPYEQMPSAITLKMWRHKLALCKPGAHIIYYKYVNFNHFRSRFEKQLVREYCSDEKIVFLNMPPARLFTLTIDDPQECLAVLEQDAKASNGKFISWKARNGKSGGGKGVNGSIIKENAGNGKPANGKPGSKKARTGRVKNGSRLNGF